MTTSPVQTQRIPDTCSLPTAIACRCKRRQSPVALSTECCCATDGIAPTLPIKALLVRRLLDLWYIQIHPFERAVSRFHINMAVLQSKKLMVQHLRAIGVQ